MKKSSIFVILIAGMLLMPVIGMAQTTASGTLAVTATLESSIQLAFVSDTVGVPLGGTSTAATLNFGTISAYGTIATANVTRSAVTATDFTVSTPFDVLVNANGSNAYTLKAALAAADANNVWTLNGTAITTAQATLTGAGTYGSNAAYTLALKVPQASTGAISNTINFVATAN